MTRSLAALLRRLATMEAASLDEVRAARIDALREGWPDATIYWRIKLSKQRTRLEMSKR